MVSSWKRRGLEWIEGQSFCFCKSCEAQVAQRGGARPILGDTQGQLDGATSTCRRPVHCRGSDRMAFEGPWELRRQRKQLAAHQTLPRDGGPRISKKHQSLLQKGSRRCPGTARRAESCAQETRRDGQSRAESSPGRTRGGRTQQPPPRDGTGLPRRPQHPPLAPQGLRPAARHPEPRLEKPG